MHTMLRRGPVNVKVSSGTPYGEWITALFPSMSNHCAYSIPVPPSGRGRSAQDEIRQQTKRKMSLPGFIAISKLRKTAYFCKNNAV